MSTWADVWAWLKTAPLPVVLASNLVLGGWVWTIASAQVQQGAEQKAAEKKVEQTDKKIDKIDEKLDKLLEAVAELKAEQKANEVNRAADAKKKDKP